MQSGDDWNKETTLKCSYYNLVIHSVLVPYNLGGPHIYPNNVFIDPNICVTSFLKLYLIPFAFICLFIHVYTNSFIQKLLSEIYHIPDMVTAATISCEQKKWTNHLPIKSAKDEIKLGRRIWRLWVERSAFCGKLCSKGVIWAKI